MLAYQYLSEMVCQIRNLVEATDSGLTYPVQFSMKLYLNSAGNVCGPEETPRAEMNVTMAINKATD